MLKTIQFTFNQDIQPEENLILGVIDNAKLVDQEEDEGQKEVRKSKYSEYNSVEAVKLLKALEKLENKEEYIVKGEKKFVERAEKMGFKVIKEPEVIKIPDEEETRKVIEEKTKELSAKFEANLEEEKKKMNDKVQIIKNVVKKAIKNG